MKKSLLSVAILIICLTTGCKKKTDPLPAPDDSMYFPPLSGTVWQTRTPASLRWNESLIPDLYTYLQQKNTKAFIILKNGRIVMEKYFGTFTSDSIWYWASAGKTLTAFLTGIAQEEGLLNIDNKTSQYLGTGWSSAPLNKENLITIRHQLCMNTGLEDAVPDTDCYTPSCLLYKSDAGSRWAYHNAPYTLLYKVIENATGQSYNSYFNAKIKSRIGMNGLWISTGFLNVYYSNARSMARFGLLMLNQGKWDQSAIMANSTYFSSMVSTSQNNNLSYGFLWWLNGKSSHMLPQTQFLFQGNLVPNAPADMYAGLGKNDQKLYVVPSQKLVVIRLGESAGNSQLALSSFDNELWGKLRAIAGF